jgi:hypothetical protein
VAKDQLLHDLFTLPVEDIEPGGTLAGAQWAATVSANQQTNTDGSVAVAAARAAGTVGPPNEGQAREPITPSELQFRAVHRLTRCPPPLQPALSPCRPHPWRAARPWTLLLHPFCAKRTTPALLRTWLTPATPAVRMLMLSSQERHEQHLQREQTRAQKMLKMQETLHLTDGEVVDRVQFARQVPCKVHCSMTESALLRCMPRCLPQCMPYCVR